MGGQQPGGEEDPNAKNGFLCSSNKSTKNIDKSRKKNSKLDFGCSKWMGFREQVVDHVGLV